MRVVFHSETMKLTGSRLRFCSPTACRGAALPDHEATHNYTRESFFANYYVLNSAFRYPENMNMAFSTINMNKLLLWHSLCFRPTQFLFRNRVARLPHDLINTTGLHFMHVVLPHDLPELLRHPRRFFLLRKTLLRYLKEETLNVANLRQLNRRRCVLTIKPQRKMENHWGSFF